MLSFIKNDNPIAIIDGGKLSGVKVYLYDEVDKKKSIRYKNPFSLLKFDKRVVKKMKKTDIDVIRKFIMTGDESVLDDVSEKVERMAEDFRSQVQRKMYRSLDISKFGGKFSPISSKKTIERIFVCGPSGAGKSTWVGKYLKQYKKRNHGEVYIFSRVEKDKPLDECDPKRVDLELLREAALSHKDFGAGNCVVFDDTDTIADRQILSSVNKTKADILECGRHKNIHTICTGHMLFDRSKTRQVLNESTSIVFFPQSGQCFHIDRLLKEFYGMDKDTRKRILNIKSRWIQLSKTHPLYLVSEKKIEII